uniref:CAAX prenyl protease 2 n=1 Tax=Heterorhabditis bacteriophora TaxID=37862 RepID=A0A1I7X2B7_HETBA
MGCGISVGLSLLFPLSYVGFLYVMDRNGTDRNDPASVKKRFIAAGINNVLSMTVTWIVLNQKDNHPLRSMGFRLDGSFNALVIPSVLVGVLYTGQWLMMYFDGQLKYIFSTREWRHSVVQITWVRDAIMAPITEEITFRCCSASLMIQCLSRSHTILICPLLFAASHFHHVGDDMRKGFSFSQAINRRAFQFLYTYVFGAYATYLFISTGHALAPIITHSLCNSLGLPLIMEIYGYPKRSQRNALWSAYFLGIAGFITLNMFCLEDLKEVTTITRFVEIVLPVFTRLTLNIMGYLISYEDIRMCKKGCT